MHELMTKAEAAAYLRVHPATVMQLVKQQKIAGKRVGRSWRFERSTIEAFAKPTPDAI